MDEGAVISDRGDYSAWMIRYQDYQVSTHCAVSLVTRIIQSEASIQRVGQWESPNVRQVSPADYLSLTQELSTPHRSVSLLITLMKSFIGSNENPGPLCGCKYCKSAMQCLDDVRPCCYAWLSQVSQVYITTITQAYIPLHLVCKYLSTLMIIVSVKSYEWMFMQTSDGYWKLETP